MSDETAKKIIEWTTTEKEVQRELKPIEGYIEIRQIPTDKVKVEERSATPKEIRDMKFQFQHYQYSLMCRNCSLHFRIYTWLEDWHKKFQKDLCCPICHSPNCYIIKRELVYSPIFKEI